MHPWERWGVLLLAREFIADVDDVFVEVVMRHAPSPQPQTSTSQHPAFKGGGEGALPLQTPVLG
jgi:hypothetical protein